MIKQKQAYNKIIPELRRSFMFNGYGVKQLISPSFVETYINLDEIELQSLIIHYENAIEVVSKKLPTFKVTVADGDVIIEPLNVDKVNPVTASQILDCQRVGKSLIHQLTLALPLYILSQWSDRINTEVNTSELNDSKVSLLQTISTLTEAPYIN